MKMALRKPRTARSMGLSDIELAEALGISLKRLVDALNEAGLCRCPGMATRQQAKDRIAASAAQGSLRTQQEERSRAHCAGAALRPLCYSQSVPLSMEVLPLALLRCSPRTRK